MSTDKPLLTFVIDPELLKRLDDWRYKNRFPTRAAAIKCLLEWALDEKPVLLERPAGETVEVSQPSDASKLVSGQRAFGKVEPTKLKAKRGVSP
jgi:hypothetical protein